MDVRVFESFNLQDAIKLVKVELGKDAVIISTREKEGYSNELGKNCRIYEVTAAPNISENGKVISAKVGEYLPKVNFPRVKSKNSALVVKDNTVKASYSPIMSALSTEVKPQNKNFYEQINKEIVRDKLISTESVENKRMNSQLDVAELRSDISRVRREIELLPQIDVIEQMQEIKVLLHDLMREKYKKSAEGASSHIIDLGIRLRAAGVSENFISHLSSALLGMEEPKLNEELINSSDKTRDFYLNETIKFIFKYLKVTDPLKSEGAKQKIICLVGATGVGKTTTVAKLAAKLKIQEGKKIELISMDGFRVAAADQLRIYSKILECGFVEVSDKNELLQVISKKSAADFIFIDTAGRSVRVAEQMESLKRVAELPLPIEFHLVVSSSMKQRDIDETIRAFRFLSPSSLIFTKLDESWAFGEILNSTVQSKIPLSYFTTGQRVPEDIEIASKERVAERILKL
ncbi:MAG: AAA family ATPase [Bdellovibrionota bacterium]